MKMEIEGVGIMGSKTWGENGWQGDQVFPGTMGGKYVLGISGIPKKNHS